MENISMNNYLLCDKIFLLRVSQKREQRLNRGAATPATPTHNSGELNLLALHSNSSVQDGGGCQLGTI